MKHTPGPWIARIFPRRDGFGIFAECRKNEIGERSLASANLFENFAYTGFFNEVETEANARLIAAAPELLAALKECIKDSFTAADGLSTGAGRTSFAAKRYEMAVTAITKAEPSDIGQVEASEEVKP